MKFTAAIDEYLADMRSQGRINSPRTERSYYARLAASIAFFGYRQAPSLDPQEARR